MRLKEALKADILFQCKQGFYLVYIIITIVYMVIISQFSFEIRRFLVPLIVFSDPSLIGFFFIGALVMLEKGQGVIQLIMVTPLRSIEYLLSKAISLTILAILVGIIITLLTYGGEVDWFFFITGIILTSFFFTLYGFLAAINCTSINQYFIKMIPYMLFLILPCFSLIGFPFSWIFTLFPSVSGLRLMLGSFFHIKTGEAIAFSLYLLFWNILLLYYVEKVFQSSQKGTY